MIFRILRIRLFGPISSEVPESTMAWQPRLQAIIFLFMEMLRDRGTKRAPGLLCSLPGCSQNSPPAHAFLCFPFSLVTLTFFDFLSILEYSKLFHASGPLHQLEPPHLLCLANLSYALGSSLTFTFSRKSSPQPRSGSSLGHSGHIIHF